MALLCLAAMGRAMPARHGDLHERIVATSQAIEAAPGSASLLLERAELYRLHLAWDLALLDLTQAERLAPELVEIEYTRAALYSDMGWHELARKSVDLFLAARPLESRGFGLSSRLHEESGKLRAAHADVSRKIELADPPQPDDYLRRASLTTRAWPDDVDRALAELDAGVQRLGSIVSLQLRAVRLLESADRVDEALVRIERMSAPSPRKERWLAMRGDILSRAGRDAAARAAYRSARSALAELRPAQRKTRAMLALEAHLTRCLSRSSKK